MSTDLEVRTPREGAALPAKIQYAKMLAESGLLPTSYRRQPANILYAIEYGDMLGLSPMAAITGIHVIEGKPTASAGLISALVRRAGHKLRVTGDDEAATCEIVRADDPSYTFRVTFTMSDAAKANLAQKDVWKKYGASMLKARAITQCARDACEEALFGLHYTPEELGAEVDGDGEVVAEIVTEAQPAGEPLRIEYGPGGTLAVDPECLDRETWLNDATEQASTLTDIEELRGLFRQAKAQLDAGIIAAEDAKRIQDLITTRAEELDAEQQPLEGEIVSEPGDEAA